MSIPAPIHGSPPLGRSEEGTKEVKGKETWGISLHWVSNTLFKQDYYRWSYEPSMGF